MKLMDILRKAGFRGEGLRMAYAIAMAESSGNAHAHNGNANTGDNSYGLFQINMLGAMGPARRQRYALSSNADLFDPLTNARVAYKMSNGGRNWSPWSTYKRGDYRRFYGGSGASVKGASSSSSSLPSSFSASGGWSPGAVKTKLDERTLADMYGLSYRLVNSDKELKKLFKKAVAGSWSAARFQASLKNTDWWRDQSKTLREYLVLKYTDPSTWNQHWQNALAEVNRMAVEVGLTSQLKSPIKRHTEFTGLLHDAVYNKLALGWTDARLKDWLGSHATVHDGFMYGEAGQVFDKLHEIAYMNGMQYKDWYELAARNIVSGKSTLEREEAKIRRDAAATYSAFADQIKAGQNVLDLASPYIKSVSQILEIPETDIDLFDKYVHNAMAGGHAGENFPLWQFERVIRSDPRWKKTNNARESIMGVAHEVARQFGMAS